MRCEHLICQAHSSGPAPAPRNTERDETHSSDPLLSTRTIVVTGGNGFVGRRVAARIAAEGLENVRTTTRRESGAVAGASSIAVGDLGAQTDWTTALRGAQAVIHCAARVHVMRESAADPLAEFRRANVDGTIALAEQAARAGVERLVFVSSIKVNGEGTLPGAPFRAQDPPNPVDPYGVSKREAEVALRQLAATTGMAVTIVRPPLVYGPGVKGNLLALMRVLARGVPLPLGGVHNRRSLVALDNLADLLVRCTRHPGALNQTFLAGDDEDLSTTELLQRLSRALGRPARLVAVPEWLIRFAGNATGKSAAIHRLLGSLQVDVSATRRQLDWTPPITVDDGLRQTAAAFLESSGQSTK